MKLNYNLSTWAYEAYAQPESLDDVVSEAWSFGYGVELWSRWKGEKDLFGPESRERIIRLLHDVPSSLHSGPVHRLEDHITQIDAARETKSGIIAVHADSLGIRPNEEPDYGLVREIVAYAKENRVVLALENADVSGMLDRMTRALDNVHGLRACLDIGHVYGASDHPMHEYLTRLADRIVHLHLQDVYMVPGTKRAREDSHRPLGRCDIPSADWQTLLSTLRKMNYQGFAVFEFRPFSMTELAAQASEFLDSISG